MARLCTGFVVAALLAASAAVAEDVEGPLPWQEPGAVGRMYLQFPFEAPEILPVGKVQLGLQLLYTNDAIVTDGPDVSVVIDFESAALTPSVRWGIAPGVEVQGALSVYVNYGGFLDGFIQHVENLFEASGIGRMNRPPGQTVFSMLRPDGSGFDLQGPRAALGDAWGGLKWAVLEGGSGVPGISLRGGLKAPTGSVGFGSGTVDLGFGAMAGWGLGPVAVRLQADVYAPMGTMQGSGLDGRPYGAFQGALTWQASRVVALHAQMSAHLSPVWSEAWGITWWTFYALVGANFRIGDAGALQVGVAENVLTPFRGADLTFLVDGRIAF